MGFSRELLGEKLVTAIKNHNFLIALSLIERGADVNYIDKDSRSPLYYIMTTDFLNLKITKPFKYFFKREWDWKYSDFYIKQEKVFKIQWYDTLEVLLTKGADAGFLIKSDNVLTCANSDKLRCEHIVFMVKNGANPLHVNILGETPLYYVNKSEFEQIVDLYLKSSIDINHKDKKGETVLMHNLNSYSFVKYLIDKGAKINIEDEYGRTPLMRKGIIQEKEIMELLLMYSPIELVNRKDSFGNTALFYASDYIIYNSHTETIKLLIKYGADVNVKNNKGETPLMRAAYHGSSKIVRVLIEKGADVFVRNAGGVSALSIAKAHLNENYSYRAMTYELLKKENVIQIIKTHCFEIKSIITEKGLDDMIRKFNQAKLDCASLKKVNPIKYITSLQNQIITPLTKVNLDIEKDANEILSKVKKLPYLKRLDVKSHYLRFTTRYNEISNLIGKLIIYEKTTKEEIEQFRKSKKVQLAYATYFYESSSFEQAANLFLQIEGYKRNAAESFFKAGKFIKSAEIYKSLMDYKEVIICFEYAEEWEKAGKLALKIKDHQKALQFFIKAENWEYAAFICDNQGNNKEAGLYYEKAGDNKLAIKKYLEGKDFENAARLYELENEFLPAADCYLNAHKYDIAIMLFIKANDFNKAAIQLKKLKKLKKAGEYFEKADKFERAANCFFREKLFEEAIRNYTRIDDYGGLSKSYGGLKKWDKAADFAKKAGNFEDAANFFEKIEDWSETANAFLQLNKTFEAAFYFEKAEEYLKAATLYEKAESYEKAIYIYNKLGNTKKANELREISNKNENKLLNAKNAEGTLIRSELKDKFENLKKRVMLIESEIKYLKDKNDLVFALQYIKNDPSGSLNKSRKLLENVLAELLVKLLGKKPKRNQSGGDYLKELEEAHIEIEQDIISRMHAVRGLGNIGSHGLQPEVSPRDALYTLEALCDIIEWFQQKYNYIHSS